MLSRPVLSFPLQRHIEQCIDVRKRLANYGIDRASSYREVSQRRLVDLALEAMHTPVRRRAVETDVASQTAGRIAQMLETTW